MSSRIKIYVACHKESYVPAHAMLFPVQVGTALAESRFNNMLPDDADDNISAKNRNYCELTAQYWAWKNEEADYFGFFHYRRYLAFIGSSLLDRSNNSPAVRKPYKIYKFPDEATLKELGYDPHNMSDIIGRYGVLAPIAEEMHVSVYDHYRQAPFQDIGDLDLALEIIGEKYPGFRSAAQEYMHSTRLYFCNMFIMQKNIFHDYCSWLFDILKEYDRRTDFSKYRGKGCRVNGYLGERLFGIYYTWLKGQRSVRWAELPRAHFEAFPGETDNFRAMRRINALWPPGTRRRAWLKKLTKLKE